MPPHPLINFEVQKCFESVTKFKGVYSRNNIPSTMKDEIYVANLDTYKSKGTHWIDLYTNANNNLTMRIYSHHTISKKKRKKKEIK